MIINAINSFKYGGPMYIENIIKEMKEFFKEIPFGIDHTLKVLQNAEDIMKGEYIEEGKELISIAAILHDIGAVEAQKNMVPLMVLTKS
ncbi:MAG: metal dependent phosphohydrolase [Herbinix sp.]|jgi:HD superfamily phosphodiesterase|nr:metal dependent phosphohydrolase [Herbinix sp.]